MMTTPQPVHSRLRHPATFGFLVIGLALLGFASWSAVAPLNGAVVAVGLVKSEANRKALQHPEGGIVKRLLVKDGDKVNAGQTLIELESVSTDANYQLLLEMAVFETIKRERLDAEQQLAPSFVVGSSIRKQHHQGLIDPAYQRELKIFQVRKAGLDQQLTTLKAQLEAIEDERRSLRTQIKADTDGVRLAAEELAMNRALESQNFVAKARLIGYERAMTDYQSRLGENEATLSQALQRANDVQLRIAGAQSDYQRLASEEYKESSNRLAELRERLRPAEDALQRKQITAPVSGTVVASRYHAAGQVAGPRDVLMEIVPDNESLIVEAQVAVDAIKDLYIGQSADLRFTAFKSRTTPIVTGKLVYVSADALNDKNGMPYYQVQIRPDAASLKSATIRDIQPGMAAEVYVLTEGRSTLDYLLSPITDTLRKSMREK